MKFYFVRHGQTDWNVLRKVQGTTDIELNETGINQAKELALKLKSMEIGFQKIYTSYQKRALKTAQIISETLQVPWEIKEGLHEMNLGDFEGHNWEEITEKYPEELAFWNSYKRYHKAPNGESYQMVLNRVFQALDCIIEENSRNVLIVTHGAVIMTLIAIQNDIPFEQAYTIEVPNATPVEYILEELMDIRKKAIEQIECPWRS